MKLISALTARKLLNKGCEGYLVVLLEGEKERPKLEDIPIVWVPICVSRRPLGIATFREVDFAIDLVPRTGPISKARYRMTPGELKKPKELLEKGFIRPSVVSP